MKKNAFHDKETANTPDTDKLFDETVQQLIAKEVDVIFMEEIRKAARELIEEAKNKIRAVVEEHKQIIREVLAEQWATVQWTAEKPLEKAKFHQGQIVRLSLLGINLKPKNTLAQKCLAYEGQAGTIIYSLLYSANNKVFFMYEVHIDVDGKTLQLTEDCLESA